MRVVVLVKCVPDTETRVKVAGDGRSLDRGDVKWVVNPYDEYALEEALRLVERLGAGEVTVVMLGGDEANSALKQCLAMGAHRAVLVSDAVLAEADGLATARALSAACRKLEPDLVLAGKQGVGHDRSQVGVMVAELLDLPHVGVVTKVDHADRRATCWREIEGGQEVVETPLPCVITAQKGLNEPRYASLKGIMAAKKKPIETWGLADLGLDPGELQPAEVWTALELPPSRPPGRTLDGSDPQHAAAELVRLLSQEAKVI